MCDVCITHYTHIHMMRDVWAQRYEAIRFVGFSVSWSNEGKEFVKESKALCVLCFTLLLVFLLLRCVCVARSAQQEVT